MGDISVKNEGMGDQQGITKNTSGLQKQLSDHARDICENSQKVEVDLLDVCELDETQNKDNKNMVKKVDATSHRFSTTTSLNHYLTNTRRYRNSVRILYVGAENPSLTSRDAESPRSICQRHSWTPINVSEDLLRLVMTFHDVMVEFIRILLSFSCKVAEVEEAFSLSACLKWKEDLFEVTYLFKYPELRKAVDYEEPRSWSIRQTGVYQKFHLKDNQSTWIIVHPNAGSEARKNLDSHVRSQSSFIELTEHPLLIHSFLLSEYIDNWRWYMASYEESVLKLSNSILTTPIDKDLDFSTMYGQLSKLRFIEKRLMPLAPIFHSYHQILDSFQSVNETLRIRHIISSAEAGRIKDTLRSYASLITTYEQNAKFLIQKVGSTAQLLSDTIVLKNQDVSQAIAHNTLKQTQFSVDDSATVRIITLVTLIYLPSTYVTGFFGMGFINVSQASSGGVSAGYKPSLVVSPYLWLYFALSIPLTLLTVGCWRWKAKRQRNRREMWSPA